MTFIYVSGAGTDSSENGQIMWARARLPFAAAYMFRPGLIEPPYGIKSKTASNRVLYTLTKPLSPWIRAAFPDHVLTTEQIGRAMLTVARQGYPKRVLESKDIRAVVQS
jgi:hypothetical protein